MKFEATSADVRHVAAQETDGGAGSHRGTGLIDFLLVDEDASGEDQSACALAAWDEVAVDEEDVKAGFGWARQ